MLAAVRRGFSIRQWGDGTLRGYAMPTAQFEVQSGILWELQAGQRARRNVPGGYWIACADPVAAMHAVILTLPVASLQWIVLATEGAAETARHLGLDDWDAIARSDQAGLSALLQHCHEWEESADPDGRKFQRAKRHDDKAIATICLSRGHSAPARQNPSEFMTSHGPR
jgi:hypothetical protein